MRRGSEKRLEYSQESKEGRCADHIALYSMCCVTVGLIDVSATNTAALDDNQRMSTA